MWESAKCDDIWCVLEMPLVWSQNHLVSSPQVRVLFHMGRWDVAAEQHRLVHVSHSADMKMNQLLPVWEQHRLARVLPCSSQHCHSSRVLALVFS